LRHGVDMQKRKLIGFVINVCLLLFSTQKLYCQNSNNYLEVSSLIKNVNANSVATLENEQVQTNAFAISVKFQYNFLVYANISFYSSSNGYVLPSGMLGIKLNTVSPSRTANFNEIPLTGGNQLVISGARATSLVTYNYNLNIGPLGFDTPPGTYNATIIFTLTQQ